MRRLIIGSLVRVQSPEPIETRGWPKSASPLLFECPSPRPGAARRPRPCVARPARLPTRGLPGSPPVRPAGRGLGRRPARSFGPWRRRIAPFPPTPIGRTWKPARSPGRQVRTFASTTAGISARFESLQGITLSPRGRLRLLATATWRGRRLSRRRHPVEFSSPFLRFRTPLLSKSENHDPYRNTKYPPRPSGRRAPWPGPEAASPCSGYFL